MRKPMTTLVEIKNDILQMLGERVDMKVNLGRKKYIEYQGTLEAVYNSVFVIRLPDKPQVETYSFSDVLCGAVKLKKV